MAVSRLIGEYPVIGIRPVIDGRRGMLSVWIAKGQIIVHAPPTALFSKNKKEQVKWYTRTKI